MIHGRFLWEALKARREEVSFVVSWIGMFVMLLVIAWAMMSWPEGKGP